MKSKMGLAFLLLLALLFISGGGDRTAAAGFEQAQPAATAASFFRLTFAGSWTPAERSAATAAAAVWEDVIWSPVPIDVKISWYDNFHSTMSASAGSYVARVQPPTFNPNATYPKALWNALSNRDSNGDEILIGLNRSEAWYAGIDGQPPAGQYDLLTAVLKGIGIGLGLESNARADCQPWSGVPGGCLGLPGSYDFPLIYEMFVVNGSGQALSNGAIFPNPSMALQAQLTGDDLYFNGAQAISANGGSPPKLYAPATWPDAQDPLLLDEQTYPRGSANALMSDRLEKGEAAHDPGPIARGMLSDLGWFAPRVPPELRPLPNIMLAVMSTRTWPDLWAFTTDPDTPLSQIAYQTTIDPSTTSLVVQLVGGHAFTFMSTNRNEETVTITVEATDPDGLTSQPRTFHVYVVNQLYTAFLPVGKHH